MVRHAHVLALAVTLAGVAAGCRAAEPERRKETPQGALPPTASATLRPTAPTPVAPKLDEDEGEGVRIDGGSATTPTGLGSASASSTAGLQANHNPKGSEPERTPLGKCPPGDPSCGLEHNPKGSEPERRPAPPPELNTR
jgi:hypothetical protein